MLLTDGQEGRVPVVEAHHGGGQVEESFGRLVVPLLVLLPGHVHNPGQSYQDCFRRRIPEQFFIELYYLRIIIWAKKGFNKIDQFLLLFVVQGDVPGHDQDREEGGEAVPGRTDNNIWEVQLSDGFRLDGGGDRACGPAGEGLPDDHHGSGEPGNDHRKPQQLPQGMSTGRNIDQAVYRRGLEILLETFHCDSFQLNESDYIGISPLVLKFCC